MLVKYVELWKGNGVSCVIVDVYLKLCESHQDINRNMLWALWGAKEQLHWTMINPREKEVLLAILDDRDR